jgi:aminoglycoside phosphotransferase (APT) family kinase protein
LRPAAWWIRFDENRGVEKASITAELVSDLVAMQFPQWAHLAVTPVDLDGNDNTTFRLGDELSVRLPSADAYVPQVDKEWVWLPFLAPHLPLPIPEPVARGVPALGFPRPWSVYLWRTGEVATAERVHDRVRFATDVAGFLSALQAVDATRGPAAGAHSFFRGGPLTLLDAETRRAIAMLEHELDSDAATAVWEAALATTWGRPPVWVHGDVTNSNLLVTDGRLSAVLDFGCLAIGDPACDLAITWTFFADESRQTFRDALSIDEGTWARGRAWALWKALLSHAEGVRPGGDTEDAAGRFGWRMSSRTILGEVLADR